MRRSMIVAITIAIVFSVLATMTIAGTALGYPGGITGYSGNPATTGGAFCTSCHDGGVAPAVTLTGPTSVAPGSTNTYTLTISGGQKVLGGLDVSATLGTLISLSGQGTKLRNGEVTHSTEKAADPAGKVSFNFSWKAPASGSATLYGAGLSADGDGGTSGDNAAGTSLLITVAASSFTITAGAGANGTITPAGVTTVNSGANQAYALTADAGYHVADVLVDGASVGAVSSYTFNNVTANHTISATFAVTTFTITASAGANGTITPAGVTTVNSGANQAYALTADA
ncbi:MAG: hypothetical protein HY681_14885, partial [Chloroflexi bacterium]|nr:hypothetical protein [Chloroflexota bacterium]